MFDLDEKIFMTDYEDSEIPEYLKWLNNNEIHYDYYWIALEPRILKFVIEFRDEIDMMVFKLRF